MSLPRYPFYLFAARLAGGDLSAIPAQNTLMNEQKLPQGGNFLLQTADEDLKKLFNIN